MQVTSCTLSVLSIALHHHISNFDGLQSSINLKLCYEVKFLMYRHGIGYVIELYICNYFTYKISSKHVQLHISFLLILFCNIFFSSFSFYECTQIYIFLYYEIYIFPIKKIFFTHTRELLHFYNL